MEDRILTYEQVAEMLQISTSTVRRYVRLKMLRSVKLNHQTRRIYESEVTRMLEDFKTQEYIVPKGTPK